MDMTESMETLRATGQLISVGRDIDIAAVIRQRLTTWSGMRKEGVSMTNSARRVFA